MSQALSGPALKVGCDGPDIEASGEAILLSPNRFRFLLDLCPGALSPSHTGYPPQEGPEEMPGLRVQTLALPLIS